MMARTSSKSIWALLESHIEQFVFTASWGHSALEDYWIASLWPVMIVMQSLTAKG
jgi:hypothetical protein